MSRECRLVRLLGAPARITVVADRLVLTEVQLTESQQLSVSDVINVATNICDDLGCHIRVVLVQITLEDVTCVGLPFAVAEQQDFVGRLQCDRESFEELIRVDQVDVVLAIGVTRAVVEVMVEVPWVRSNNTLRGRSRRRVDGIDSRMVEVDRCNCSLASEVDLVGDAVI